VRPSLPALGRALVVLLLPASLVVPAAAAAPAAAPLPSVAAPAEKAGSAPADRAAGRLCANGRPSRIFRDPVDGPRGVEARGIGVWNKDGDACYWVTAFGRFNAARTQVIRLFIDASGDNRYEYQAFAYSNKDRDNRKGAYLVRYVEGSDGEVDASYVSCRLFRAFLIGRGEVRLGIPKTCMPGAGQIRLQAAVFDITRYQRGNRWRGYADVIPNRTFYTPRF
jgi:hypothetical protein